MVEFGVVRTGTGEPIEQRLLAVITGIEQWLDRHEPEAVAVERVFAQANVRSVTGTAQVAGLAMVAAARRGITVASHTPSEVKAAVTGNGRAEKAQVGEMVRRILELAATPTPADAADALALALCHAWRSDAPTARSRADGEGAAGMTPAQRAWAQAEGSRRGSSTWRAPGPAVGR